MVDERLDIIVKARDEASSSLKQSRAAVKDLKKEVTETSGAMNKMSSSWTSVFAGMMAWDLVRSGARAAVGFIRESVAESVESAAAMVQVERNVRNAGLSFEALAPSIKKASEAALKLGFDDEAAALSLSRLTLATGDYQKAVILQNLAMDLARSKSIGLEQASALVRQVLAGNTRALKDYGIELDETASVADVLATLFEQVKGSATDYADTTAGKLEANKEQWLNIKQAVGDDLMPAVTAFINLMHDGMPVVGAALRGVTGEFIAMVDAVRGLAAIPGFIGDTAISILDRLTGNKPSGVMGEDYMKGIREDAKKLGEEIKKTGITTVTTASTIKSAFAGYGTSAKEATSGMKSLVSQFISLEDKLKDLRKQAEADEIKNATAGMDAKQKAAALYVEQEQRIVDLKKEAADIDATTFDGFKKKQEALAKVAQAEADLSGQAMVPLTMQGEYAEALRRSRMTDFGRSMEDLRMGEISRNLEYSGRRAENGAQQQETKTQIFNFNFNGDVNDKEALKREVIEAINRKSALAAAGM